eukprot:1332127-Pleurochrysis_carterae.AAC.2
MRTSAATNKCEFGCTTPSGEEPRWGPTRFTLYAEFHKCSRKVKTNTARTFHTVRGALILNEQRKWCELCAWAHGKDCQRLEAYRAEEARRTQELLARAKRESASTRAQQQAARPEYTLSVEKEKPVRGRVIDNKEELDERGVKAVESDVLIWNAGSGGSGPHGVRESANGFEGARDKLRAELNAVKTQSAGISGRMWGIVGFSGPNANTFPANASRAKPASG